MSKSEEDIRTLEEQWKQRGWHVKILDFSPDIVLMELDGAFSAQQLEELARFLREVADND